MMRCSLRGTHTQVAIVEDQINLMGIILTVRKETVRVVKPAYSLIL